jgi:pimeloyl-ACP methyl ester carboxylesterase
MVSPFSEFPSDLSHSGLTKEMGRKSVNLPQPLGHVWAAGWIDWPLPSLEVLRFLRLSLCGTYVMKRFSLLPLLLYAFSLAPLAAQPSTPLIVPESKLPAKHNIAVFGQKIKYYDMGSGPVLVLVHGFGSEARFDWGNVLTPLAAHHRVIALDQIGFGASDKPFIDYSVQTYVDFLGEFLRRMHIQQFTLAGESLGGWISALYTIESLAPANIGPDALPKPKRLILEDAAGISTERFKDHSLPIPIAGTLAGAQGVAIVFHDKSRVTEEVVREAWEMKMKANDGFTERSFVSNPKVVDEGVKDRIGAISIPTLVVWGGNDELVSLDQGRTYAAGIPGAKLILVPECGHAPSIEKPKEFLAAFFPFIDGK